MTKHYHICGIGGTAMASLAVMLKEKGYRVTGSDKDVYPPVSDMLTLSGIEYSNGYSEKNIASLNPDITVIGNALSRGNPEVEYLLEHKKIYSSIGETVKEEFIRGNKSVVITGTHGKTTCSSLTAHIFETAGLNPGFLIGGIPGNFSVSGRPAQHGGYFVIEGDEYDNCFYDKRSKFFHYLPDSLLINNIEFDHGDIFRDLDEIKRAFSYLQRLVPRNGVIAVNGDDKNVLDVIGHHYAPVVRFGFSKSNNAIIKDVIPTRYSPGMKFALQFEGEETYWEVPLFGYFNVMNAVGVILLSILNGISHDIIQKGLSSYKRPKKRLEEKTKNIAVRVYDDFAHHPTAIRETIHAIRTAFPDNRLIAVYEPRSNTSVRKYHQEQMRGALEKADMVYIYKLHRMEDIAPEERLNVPQIVSELNNAGGVAYYIENFDELKSSLSGLAKPDDIFLIMSQGNFNNLSSTLADKAEVLIKQLSDMPVLQTAHHLTPTLGPVFNTVDIISLQSLPQEAIYPAAVCSGVAYSNSARSGALCFEYAAWEDILMPGAVLHSAVKSQREREAHGDPEKRISLIPSRLRDGLLYGSLITEQTFSVVSAMTEKLKPYFPLLNRYILFRLGSPCSEFNSAKDTPYRPV
ncbi:hypothetical protein CHS0354_001971 [Potamilus streckersoni]|uniref:UDP-N-acetylmuramate:L-alanyl-gamma-D-glutamyl-meso-diaminopimelate ligase n=1 Tax=Potamilus streckersoni TaxID=2493646 RepID=A0AAE0T5J5_9BIVA|nr:hypothetical protein CHS0354_001971 [Potamilus streckersoni]